MSRRTFYQLLIDRSASMQSRIEETIMSINEQINCIRQKAMLYPENETYVSISIFNQYLIKVFVLQKTTDIKDVTYSDFRADGLCALYDALDFTISDLKACVSNFGDKKNSTIVIIIFSDGADNASLVCNKEQITNTINMLTKTNHWSFRFVDLLPENLPHASGF